VRPVAPFAGLEDTTTNTTNQVAKHVGLEHTTAKPARQVAKHVGLEDTTAKPAKQVAKHVRLEHTTVKPAKEVAPSVTLENTAQLVRIVVTILTLRVPPVLIPTERTNVSNVTQEISNHIKVKIFALSVTLEHTAQLVRTLSPFAGLERTAQLVRTVAPHVTLENTTTKPARQVQQVA
jgi:ethanolamine utilization microcompartment shell protein EutS